MRKSKSPGKGRRSVGQVRETNSREAASVPSLLSNAAPLDRGNLDSFLSALSFRAPERVVPSAWHEHAPFAFWLVQQLKPEMLVELGTHHGFSYFAFCQAIRMAGLSTAAFAVDRWTGDEHAGYYGEEVYQSVEAFNVERYQDVSTLLKMPFSDALAYFEDGSIDLLQLDGRHFYDDVKADFESWFPKLSDRAVVLFHDINVREREFGVHRFWSERCEQYPNFSFLHGHGLGVLGVGKDRPPNVSALFKASTDLTLTASIRNAYARLGGAVTLSFRASEARQQQALAQSSVGGLTAALRKRDEELQQALNRVAEVDELKRSLEQAVSKNVDLAAQSEGQSSSLASVRLEAEQLRTEQASLSQRLSDLSDEHERLRADAEEKVAELKEAVERAHVMLSAERQKAAEQAEQLSEVEEHRRVAEANYAGEAVEAAQLRLELAVQARIAAEQSAFIGALRLTQSSSEEEKASLTVRIDEFKRALSVEQEGRTAALERVQQLEDELGRRDEQLRSLEEEIDAVRKAGSAASASSNQTISALEDKVDTLHRSLDEKSAAEARYLSAEQQWRSQLEQRETELTRAASELDETRQSKHGLEQEIQTLRRSPLYRIHGIALGVRRRVTTAWRLIRYGSVSPLFDEQWYLSSYPDVAEAGIDPYSHYLAFGAKEGRFPNPLFDTSWYLERYPDVRDAGVNPLVHYLRYGASEGRDPNPLFDSDWYLQQYPDVQAAGVNPLVHYLRYGASEGRDPNPLFDSDWYFQQYPDVQAAGINPLVHYLHHGAAEGHEMRQISPFVRSETAPSSASPTVVQPFGEDMISIDALDEAVAALMRRIGPLSAATGAFGILFALPLFGRGGSEKVALSFARAFLEKRERRSALLLVTDLDHLDESIELPPSVYVLRLVDFCQGLPRDGAMAVLFRLLQALRPEVFHIINSDLSWKLLGRKGERVKRLTRVFGSIFCVQRDYATKAPIGYAANYLGVAQLYCESLLTDNKSFPREAAQIFPSMGAVSAVTIYNPLACPSAEPEPAAQKEPDLPSVPTVLWAGRLDRQKRADLLFDIAQRLPDVRFCVFGSVVTDGDVPMRPLPNVEFRGGFRRPEELFRDGGYHAYVYTSHEDGLPNILLEIGAYGVPIVAPAIGGIPELISDETGILLGAEADAKDYETALRAIFAAPASAKQRAQKLISLIRERHSWAGFQHSVESIPNYLGTETRTL
jgi:glycosyltransferase involved in cell wall biosynthesis